MKSYDKTASGQVKKDDALSLCAILNQIFISAFVQVCNIFQYKNNVELVPCPAEQSLSNSSTKVKSPKDLVASKRKFEKKEENDDSVARANRIDVVGPAMDEEQTSSSSTSHVSRGRGAKLNTTYFSPLMLLLIFSMVGGAEAAGDRIHQVSHVNMHILSMIMVATAIVNIRWFYLKYLPDQARRMMIHSQESDPESPPVPTPGSYGDPLSSFSHFYRDRTICSGHQNPQHSSSHPIQCSSDTDQLSYSYLAGVSFDPAISSFEGDKLDTDSPQLPVEVAVREERNHPTGPEIVVGSGLPTSVEETKKRRGSLGGRDVMVLPRCFVIEIGIPCEDSDMFSFNANVEELTGEPEDHSLPNVADCTQPFLGIASEHDDSD